MNLSPNSLAGGKTVTVKGRYSTYELQGVLGKGGSAVVYRATDLYTHETVAAKKITARDSDAMHQWRTEVETLMTLRDVDGSHHVIRYLDHLVHENTILIVEEYAANGSLQAHLKQRGGGGGFDERVVARLVHQITSGLAFIHSKGIVHRDLKCANALVCEDGQVKLSDFGLSATDPKRLAEEAAKATMARSHGAPDEERGEQEDGEEAANPVMGSVYWMAPETIRGQEANPSSDIWSLGCLCIELLTGRPPFFDRPPASALYHIAEGKEPVPLPSGPLSEAGKQFIQSCLAHDPEKRPTARKLLQSPWFTDVRVQLRLDAIVAQAAQGGEGVPTTTTTTTPATTADSPASSTVEPHRAAAPPPQRPTTPPRVPQPPPPAEASDSVGQWVETSLFSDSPSHNEAWAREALPKLVVALPYLTPTEAHDAIRSFAYAAEKMGPAFVDPLGASAFWDYPGLSSTDETPIHALMMFEACCQHQSAHVRIFAPACSRAIVFFLTRHRSEVARRCIEALHALYCGPTDRPGAAHPSALDEQQQQQQQQERVKAARQRLVSDGGLPTLRTYLEMECQSAFLKDGPPALGWPLVDKLFHVVLATLDADGADTLVWGSGRDPLAAEEVSRTSDAEDGKTTEGHVSEGNVGSTRTAGDAAKAKLAGQPGEQKDDSNPRAMAASPVVPGSSTDANSSSNSAIFPLADGAATSLEHNMLKAVQRPAVQWYLAIQEASRSGLAPRAAQLLLKLIDRLAGLLQQDLLTPPRHRHPSNAATPTNAPMWERAADGGPSNNNNNRKENMNLSSDEESVAVAEEPAPLANGYLERAGVSLAGLLIGLACCRTLPDRLRIRVLQCIPVLRGCSTRAATFLADEYCTVPLYAYLLTRLPAPALGGRREVLLMLLGLCDADPRICAACAQSSLLSHALAQTLCAAAVDPEEESEVPPPGRKDENVTRQEETAADLSLCLRLCLLLRGATPPTESSVMAALVAKLAQSAEAMRVVRAYANDAATPADQSQLCAEALKLMATGKATITTPPAASARDSPQPSASPSTALAGSAGVEAVEPPPPAPAPGEVVVVANTHSSVCQEKG